jgi:hypothetical protein
VGSSLSRAHAVWQLKCAASKKPPPKCTKYTQPLVFMSLGDELATFPHVHEVHDVHEVHHATSSFQLSKIPVHCRAGRFSPQQRNTGACWGPGGGWTADISEEAGCIALLPHLEVASQ